MRIKETDNLQGVTLKRVNNTDYFTRDSSNYLLDQSLSSKFTKAENQLLNSSFNLICLSHLRWDFVWQRPQHLLSRCAQDRSVFFVEEPIFGNFVPYLDIQERDCGVKVVVPHLPQGLDEIEIAAIQQSLLIDELLIENGITDYILWYYTPMAISFTRDLDPLMRIYDCMDELSAFKNAPHGLKHFEAELFENAELVFTGGHSLYEAKKHLHKNIHPFPSSIEAAHFGQAREFDLEPIDQRSIHGPKIGFFGVIDERMDLELLAGLAENRPDWQFILLGPVVKIDPADLPKRDNIHYLGSKDYKELPAYLAGWDIAMLPFARNESTRFISPTKTPEYLAAGVPVISTSIKDVVSPYGQQGLVKIADTVPEFIQAAESFLGSGFNKSEWLERVDDALAFNSWDLTWSHMLQLINAAISKRYKVEKLSGLPVSSEALMSRAAHPMAGK